MPAMVGSSVLTNAKRPINMPTGRVYGKVMGVDDMCGEMREMILYGAGIPQPAYEYSS